MAGTWGMIGSLLMAVFILGRAVTMGIRWFRTNGERNARNRRIAEQDAARRQRLEDQIAKQRSGDDGA